MAVICGLAGAGLAVVYGAGQVLDAPGWARSVVKTGSVLLLAGAAVLCGGPWLLATALVVSALGDLMLSRPGDAAFRAGVAAFAAGHVAYVALFLSVPAAGPAQIGFGDVMVGAALLILGLGIAVLLWPRTGALRGPVTGYVAIILCMGWAALAVPGAGALWLVLPGAILFVASDTVLALERFVITGDPSAAAGMARFVWGTYWSAQALFTLAFCLQSLR
jgi:uncharacterized membrane protein YhhN